MRFPQEVSTAIGNLKIESYPLLYENEAAIGVIVLHAFMSIEEIQQFAAELDAATPEERGEELRGLLDGLDQLDLAFEIPKTPADRARAESAFKALSTQEQAQAVKTTQYLWMGFLAGFFQNLSMMVHGEKLTALVAQAKAGDDEALCKAVQIDKRTLTTISHFKRRFEQATLAGDQDFVDRLAYRLQCAPYKGKIRHKALWMAFAFLDAAGLLDSMRHQELLDLLDEAGVGGYANRIEDVKHLSKRLVDYRRFRGYGLTLSTP